MLRKYEMTNESALACAVQTFHLSAAAKSTPGVYVGWIARRARHLPCEGLSGFLPHVFISWISGQNFLWKPSLVRALITHPQDPMGLVKSASAAAICGLWDPSVDAPSRL